MKIKSLLFVILLSPVLFSCHPLIKLGNDPEGIKWENEITILEALPSSISNETILFTGSSSIRLWDSIATDMLPFQAIGRGYGGAKLSDYVYYADRLVKPHACGAIVLFIANDITGDSKDITPSEVLKLFKTTVAQMRKSHPDTPVFWIEVTPTPSRWTQWPLINQTNQLIMNYCADNEKLFFIQTSHRFLLENGLPDKTLFVQDMLHLNHQGYQVWSECIKVELNKQVPELKIISEK
ncbi:MAG: GDSL-type esterase/lipase family protein [Lentimicrobium sp.]|jgi:hypothetical protein|nr:GDSL-type esterase/lipase family protein [Lentimicrobium sp.]